jgi:hypothetical protein
MAVARRPRALTRPGTNSCCQLENLWDLPSDAAWPGAWRVRDRKDIAQVAAIVATRSVLLDLNLAAVPHRAIPGRYGKSGVDESQPGPFGMTLI